MLMVPYILPKVNVASNEVRRPLAKVIHVTCMGRANKKNTNLVTKLYKKAMPELQDMAYLEHL